MSIGGVDVVLIAPSSECLPDIILRSCQRFWFGERCLFQDAEDVAPGRPLDDPWVWQVGTASKEFFVFRNEAAAQSWEAEGATRSNVNTMFHFILGDAIARAPESAEVTLVCDRLTPPIKEFIEDLKETFLSIRSGVGKRAAA